MGLRIAAVLLLVLCASSKAYADVALLLGEPYGRMGSIRPNGHVAVYLSHVCAVSPTALRRCEPGEAGVVISRYHRVAGLDWVAIPLMPYLYAVERAGDVPPTADAVQVASLRDAYRRAHLHDLIPDDASGAAPKGEWVQLVGAAYDRRIIAFSMRTDAGQDDELIADLNARRNSARFNLLTRNCADFAEEVIGLYYPNAVRRSLLADLGIMTPKRVAQALVRHGRRTPGAVVPFVIAQVPGSRPPSRAVRGVVEALVKSKKYVVPLIVVQPWVPVGLTAGYLVSGRFDPDRYARVVYTPDELERGMPHVTAPGSPDDPAHVVSVRSGDEPEDAPGEARQPPDLEAAGPTPMPSAPPRRSPASLRPEHGVRVEPRGAPRGEPAGEGGRGGDDRDDDGGPGGSTCGRTRPTLKPSA